LSQGFDLPRIERAVREILLALGEDPERDGLRDTPARVARAYAEHFFGIGMRPNEKVRNGEGQKKQKDWTE